VVLEAPLRARCDEALSWFGVDGHLPDLAAAHNAFVIEGMSAAATALGLRAWRFVLGVSLRQVSFDAGESLPSESLPAESVSSEREPRRSGMAESGVRLIAAEPGASRVKAG
jgi:hypothetical protein